MASYLSPDVYVENNDVSTLNIEASTGVAGFVGIAQRGPINQAIHIQTWNQFINNFAVGMDSPFIAGADLAYAVYGFFQNGGSECVVIRTAHETAEAATIAAGDSGLTAVMTAKDPGTWGNKLSVSVSANEDEPANFDLTTKLNGTVVETIQNLSNTADDSNYWINRVNVESSYVSATSGTLKVTTSDATFSGGADGVDDIEDADFVSALNAFQPFNDSLGYIAVPGQTSQDVITGVLNYCYDGSNIVPVIEAPKTANTAAVKALRKTNENFTGVLVWPWGYVTDPLSKASAPNNIRACPPSGHYMGVMSRIGEKRGVWKAPAGIEATVKGFVSLVTEVTKDDTDVLNPIGVVSIRTLTNYGICVWGARSLNSKDDNFKYVSDLLLDAYIKRQCYIIGLPYVFEGNRETTWTELQSVTEAFMDGLMKNHAFKTDKKETAYFVKCDAELNQTHADKNDGIIEVEVGYAGVKPGEFIVFRISHTISNS